MSTVVLYPVVARAEDRAGLGDQGCGDVQLPTDINVVKGGVTSNNAAFEAPANSSEAMLNPNYPEWFLAVSVPANTTFEFKFIKKDSAGNVIWESGTNRVFTSSSDPNGTQDSPLYSWQN